MTDPNALPAEAAAADLPPVIATAAGTHEPVERPDLGATAEALGGNASLSTRSRDPSIAPPDQPPPDAAPATAQGSPTQGGPGGDNSMLGTE